MSERQLYALLIASGLLTFGGVYFLLDWDPIWRVQRWWKGRWEPWSS